MQQTKPILIFVTGMSGAGMSSVMSILEDIGFAVYDNFPLNLLSALLEQEKNNKRSIAICIDARAHHFNPTLLLCTINTMKEQNDFQTKSIFLSADDAVLLKRFSETRRTHPLARDRSVADGIAAEKSLLFALKHEAGYVIDTSEYSVHDLRRVIEGYAGGLQQSRLNITIMSFSYRHGLPRESDLVFDVRFLRNPHWDEKLRDKTGLDVAVQNYVKADETYIPFIDGIKNLLNISLPRYKQEGKSYLTITFGCTGGKHRSVTITEEIAEYLKENGYIVNIHHRELKK